MGLSLRGSTSGSIDINPPAVAGNNTITLPGDNGSANQFFRNSTTAGIVTYSSMVEDSSGNIGIGTDAPQTTLHLLSSAPIIRLEDSDSTGVAALQRIEGKTTSTQWFVGQNSTSDNELWVYNVTNDDIRFGTNNNERLRITSTGNVGIGTDNPTTLLDVRESSAFVTDFLTLGGDRNASDTEVGILFKDRNAVIGLQNAARIHSLREGSNGHFSLVFSTSLSTDADATEKVRITSEGLIGIGTDNPTVLLDLESSTPIIKLTDNDATGTPECQISGAGGDLILEADRDNEKSGTVMAFTVDSTERLRITNTGQTIGVTETNHIFGSERASSGTETLVVFRHSATATTASGTNAFIIRTNGNAENINDSYGAISDIKLKENIVDAESQWDDFKAVRFRKYNFKEETGHETFTQLGVIAQELELVSPGLVYETPDLDEDGNDLGTTTKSVKYSVLTKKALVALQEAMERIETLETTNASQAVTIAALDARLTALEGA